MKLSTKGRYGIKAIVDIALEQGNAPVAVSTLAQKQGVSDAYLEQLVASLKRAGLISSIRGAQGGYVLSREPEKITVGEVLEALEGNTALVDCVGTTNAGCENACSCSARPLWLKLQAQINGVLNSTTVKDMVDDYKIQMRRVENEKSLS